MKCPECKKNMSIIHEGGLRFFVCPDHKSQKIAVTGVVIDWTAFYITFLSLMAFALALVPYDTVARCLIAFVVFLTGFATGVLSHKYMGKDND